MAYVDLNPVRAGICKTPEEAIHTGIYNRIHHGQASNGRKLRLLKLSNSPDCPLPIDEADYLKLVDYSGRIAAKGKPGSVTMMPPK